MPYVVWSEMFSVGIPHIDKQHQGLFEITNRFHEAIDQRRGQETVFDILNSLVRYAQDHFRDEEEMMRGSDFPDEEVEAHIRVHEQLVQDIFDLLQSLRESGEKSVHELETFTNNWMIKHILVEDKKYQPHCHGQREFKPGGRG
jgi:hemerythrin-like metal-binding protein